MTNYPLILYRDGFETRFEDQISETIRVTGEADHRIALSEGWRPATEYLQLKIARAAMARVSIQRRPKQAFPESDSRLDWMPGMIPHVAIDGRPHAIAIS